MDEKELSIFLENFDHIDSAFLHPKHGLYGKTLAFDCTMKGPVNHNGFIVDFGWVKKSVKEYLRERFDHKLVVFNGPDHTLIQSNQGYELQFKIDDQLCYYKCPTQALEWVDDEVQNVNEFLSSQLEDFLLNTFKTLTEVKVRCYLPFKEHSYSYTHGLSKHEGACQRLLHGHSTTIKVEPKHDVNHWNKAFEIFPHIASTDQLHKEDDVSYILKYTGNEGLYELKIPKNRVWLIKPTASIESIARHLFENHHNLSSLEINEGMSKGAKISTKPM